MDTVKQWTKGDERVVLACDTCPPDADDVLADGVHIAYKATSRIRLGTDPVSDLDEWEEAMQATHHPFPVYAHVHSGVALSLVPFHDPWDSGRSGTIAIPKDWGDEVKAWQAALAALEEFTAWLNGEVFMLCKLRRCECCGEWRPDPEEPPLGNLVGLNWAEKVAREEFGVDDTWEEEE